MTTRILTLYFIGPNLSGNIFGGATFKSEIQKTGAPFNNKCFILIKDTTADGIEYISYDGPNKNIKEHISEETYISLKTLWNNKVNTLEEEFIWQTEERTQTW